MKGTIILRPAMQGMGWDQDGCLFSLDGAFLSEKNNNIRVGHARDGMRSERMTLFVRRFFCWAKRKRNIRVGHARDGMRSGRMTLFVRWCFFEWKENNIRGRHAGMGWDQDGGLKSNIRMGHARDGTRSGRMPLFIRQGLSKRKEKSY